MSKCACKKDELKEELNDESLEKVNGGLWPFAEKTDDGKLKGIKGETEKVGEHATGLINPKK